MKIVQVKSKRDKVRKVKKLINAAGNHLFAVSFIKRSDGSLRKMACRRYVTKPTYASVPTGKKFKKHNDNSLMVVFDVNKINYNRKNRMNGRGAWRTIPLENVMRVKVGGEIYKITK